MAGSVLRKARFAENKGCVLPSVKYPTCRQYAVSQLTQQEERDSKLEILKKDEENQQLKEKVKDLEEALIRTQEENLRLISELQKYQGLHRENDQQLERQAVDLQKQKNEYEEGLHRAAERIREMETKLRSLESSFVKIVKMAVKRELQLQECHDEKEVKEQEVFTLRSEISNLQEQRREHEKRMQTAGERVLNLEASLKSLEVCYVNMVKNAVDRELELQDCEKKISLQQSNMMFLEFELSRIKEQSAVKEIEDSISRNDERLSEAMDLPGTR